MLRPKIDQSRATGMTALGFYEMYGSAVSGSPKKEVFRHPIYGHHAAKKILNFRNAPHDLFRRLEGPNFQ
jgi:hypothetical protein